MWRKLWKKFFAFELKTPSRFYFCSSCSCVLFFSFSFHSVNKNDLEVPRKYHLKIRKTTTTGKGRLWYPGRWKRERNSEWKKWIAFSLLPLLDLFFTNVFPCCTIYPTCMLVFPFGSNFLKRKFLSWKTKSNTIPMSQDLQWKIWNLEVRTRLLQEGFISKSFLLGDGFFVA